MFIRTKRHGFTWTERQNERVFIDTIGGTIFLVKFKVGQAGNPFVDEIFAIDGVVEEFLAKDEIIDDSERKPSQLESEAVDSILDQVRKKN